MTGRAIDTREVRKALKEVRRLNRMVDGYLNTRDMTSAYRAAEQMQHAAFEAKRLCVTSGTFDPERVVTNVGPDQQGEAISIGREHARAVAGLGPLPGKRAEVTERD